MYLEPGGLVGLVVYIFICVLTAWWFGWTWTISLFLYLSQGVSLDWWVISVFVYSQIGGLVRLVVICVLRAWWFSWTGGLYLYLYTYSLVVWLDWLTTLLTMRRRRNQRMERHLP